MKKVIILAVSALLMGCFVSCNEKGGDKAYTSPLTDSVSMLMGDLYGNGMGGQMGQDSTMDKKEVLRGIEAILRADTSNHSYMTGMQVGMQLLQMFTGVRQQYGFAMDQQQFIKHFKEAFLQDSAISEEAMRELQQQIEPMMRRAGAEAKQNDPKSIENKKAGEAYLNKKAAEEGYTKTASGLVYKVITEGAGENFVDGDVVMVRYTGKHIDGSEFDASKEDPVPFRLNQVVPGFAEMIKMMKPGSKVEVIIPSDLAYGIDGTPNGPIGPNETLVFEIETVERQQADAKPAAPAPAPAK